MIKLLWNTHNQKKSNTTDKRIQEEEEGDYAWGIYHKKNSNLWIEEILKKINYNIITNETNLEKDDILIVVDSSVEKKKDFYTKINLICSKILNLFKKYCFCNFGQLEGNVGPQNQLPRQILLQIVVS